MNKKKTIGWIMVILGGAGFIKYGIILTIKYTKYLKTLPEGWYEGMLPANSGLGILSLIIFVLGLFYVIRGKLN